MKKLAITIKFIENCWVQVMRHSSGTDIVNSKKIINQAKQRTFYSINRRRICWQCLQDNYHISESMKYSFWGVNNVQMLRWTLTAAELKLPTTATMQPFAICSTNNHAESRPFRVLWSNKRKNIFGNEWRPGNAYLQIWWNNVWPAYSNSGHNDTNNF